MGNRGFTLIEVLIAFTLVAIFLAVVGGGVLNNRGWTEKRALVAAKKFLAINDVKARRLTCAGDSGGDGYGTCNVVTSDGEKIILNCPTDYFSVNWFKASGCKEVFQNYNINLEGN